MKSSGRRGERNLNHVAFLVLRVNLLRGKSGQESKLKLTEFRDSVHIGFIDICLLQLKEKGLQQKQKRKKEGKYNRKRRRRKAQERERERERERESPSCLVGAP
jgi:hypothetical protein